MKFKHQVVVGIHTCNTNISHENMRVKLKVNSIFSLKKIYIYIFWFSVDDRKFGSKYRRRLVKKSIYTVDWISHETTQHILFDKMTNCIAIDSNESKDKPKQNMNLKTGCDMDLEVGRWLAPQNPYASGHLTCSGTWSYLHPFALISLVLEGKFSGWYHLIHNNPNQNSNRMTPQILDIILSKLNDWDLVMLFCIFTNQQPNTLPPLT